MAFTTSYPLILGLFSTFFLSPLLAQNSLSDFLRNLGEKSPTTSGPVAPIDPGAMAKFLPQQPPSPNLPTLTIASSNVPVITQGNIIIAVPTKPGGNGGGNNGAGGGDGGWKPGGGNGGWNPGGGNGGWNPGGGNGGWNPGGGNGVGNNGSGGGWNPGGGGNHGGDNNGGRTGTGNGTGGNDTGGNGTGGNGTGGTGGWPSFSKNPLLSIVDTMARTKVLRRLKCKTVSQVFGLGRFLSPCYNSCPFSFTCITVDPKQKQSIGYCCPYPVTEEWVNIKTMLTRYGTFSEMMS